MISVTIFLFVVSIVVIGFSLYVFYYDYCYEQLDLIVLIAGLLIIITQLQFMYLLVK